MKPPPYRRQRRKNANDLAYTTINGTRHYLGTFGTPESRDKYAALLAELQTHGGHTKVSQDTITITEVAAKYLDHCRAYYRRKDGQSTHEAEQIALALPCRDQPRVMGLKVTSRAFGTGRRMPIAAKYE